MVSFIMGFMSENESAGDDEIIRIVCPACELVLDVRRAWIGKKVKCKSCKHAFVIEAPVPPPPQT